MELIFKEESYQIIGCCFEVHKELGKGFNEIVYKDALEIEFRKKQIFYQREKEFRIEYKGIEIPHKYYADFVVLEKIILEIKAIEKLTSSNIKQTLNYLASSKLKLGILVNFGADSLQHQRIIL